MPNEKSKQQKPAPNRRRRWVLRIVTVLMSFAVGLAFVEVALRITWTPTDPRRMSGFDFRSCLQPDDELGHIPIPGARVEYPAFGVTFTVNEDGYRGEAVSIERNAARRRIVVLGDSFAWGHGVEAPNAFPEILAQQLKETDVVNLGVPGFDLRDERIWYERIGRQFRPDVVVLSVCQNDIRDLDGEARALATGAVLPQMVVEDNKQNSSVFREAKDALARSSYAYQYLQQAINTNKPLAKLAVHVGLKESLGGFEFLDDNLRPALRHKPPSVERAWQQFESDLRKLAQDLSEDQTTLIVALIPCRQAVEPNELANSLAYTQYETDDFDLDAPAERIAVIARDVDALVVNPTETFRERAASESLYLTGDLHFNARGHRIFAEAISAALRSLSDRDFSSPSSLTRNR